MRIETSETSTEVAIVGAGPVGLLLGGELACRGVGVVMFERADSPSLTPKANGLVGRAAVELAKTPILAGSGLRVVSPPRFPFGPLTLRLGFGPGNPLHVSAVPQRRLEDLLERRAVRYGAQLPRGHDVTGFDQSESGVTIDLRHGGGTATASTRYLVGCDGVRSLVRKHAGIGFPGFTSDRIDRIARVRIPSAQITRSTDGFDISGIGPVAALRPNQRLGGSFTIAPVTRLDPSAPPDLYLISTQEPRGDAQPSNDATVDELRASLLRVLGVELPFTEATAMRSTVANSRQADAYQVGRVFLAGDAAHIFNAGGSSLNVGLLDAFDLARRLSAVFRDGAAEDHLAGYEAARRPAGERALALTRAQAALSRDDDSSQALRHVIEQPLSTRSASRRLARLIEGT